MRPRNETVSSMIALNDVPNLLLVSLLALLMAGCDRSEPFRPDGDGAGVNAGQLSQMLFRSGFEPGTTVISGNSSGGDIIGVDHSVSDAPNDWVTNLEGRQPYLGAFSIQYQGGDTSQRYVKLTEDPTDASNQVLEFTLLDTNVPPSAGGPKARIQANLYGNRGLREVSLRIRLYLAAGFPELAAANKTFWWLTLFEFWNNAGWYEPFPFRVTVNVIKPRAEPGSGLYLQAYGQTQKGRKFTDVWRVTADATPLPVGKWMTVEIHLLEGDSASGRFEIWLTVDGEPRKRIINVTGATHHPDDRAPDGLTDFNPFKLYTSEGLIGALANVGLPLTVYWDDFEVFAGRLP